MEIAAKNIERALGLSPETATLRAKRMESQLEHYRTIALRPRRALNALLAIDDPLSPEDWNWLLSKRSGPFVLALPLSLAALAIIGRLFASGRHFLCIEETSLTSGLLGILGQLHRGKRAMVAPAPAMIRHRRMTAVEELANVVYVTFPDHHRSSEGTSRVVSFFGGEHYVPITEPLLYFRGVSPVVTLGAEALARYEIAPAAPVTERDAMDLLAWLIGHVETFAAQHELLSWGALSQRTCEAIRLNRGVEARMVEGFVRAWQSGDRAIDGDTFQWSLAELSRIHATSKSRAKELQ